MSLITNWESNKINVLPEFFFGALYECKMTFLSQVQNFHFETKIGYRFETHRQVPTLIMLPT